MPKVLERIKQLKLNLPNAPAPAANYVPFIISNKNGAATAVTK